MRLALDHGELWAAQRKDPAPLLLHTQGNSGGTGLRTYVEPPERDEDNPPPLAAEPTTNSFGADGRFTGGICSKNERDRMNCALFVHDLKP
jgi:hypothetical protein